MFMDEYVSVYACVKSICVYVCVNVHICRLYLNHPHANASRPNGYEHWTQQLFQSIHMLPFIIGKYRRNLMIFWIKHKLRLTHQKHSTQSAYASPFTRAHTPFEHLHWTQKKLQLQPIRYPTPSEKKSPPFLGESLNLLQLFYSFFLFKKIDPNILHMTQPFEKFRSFTLFNPHPRNIRIPSNQPFKW